MIYLLLAYEFFKIGLFAFGGALAALPFLYDLSDKYGWFSRSELIDMIAVSESTPGPLGANMATYVGYHVGGVPGSLVATLALIIPSIVITLLICVFLKRFMEHKYVQWSFYGLRAAVAGLIAGIALSLVGLALYGDTFESIFALNWKSLVLLALFLPAVFIGKKHPVLYIGTAAIIGIVFKF